MEVDGPLQTLPVGFPCGCGLADSTRLQGGEGHAIKSRPLQGDRSGPWRSRLLPVESAPPSIGWASPKRSPGLEWVALHFCSGTALHSGRQCSPTCPVFRTFSLRCPSALGSLFCAPVSWILLLTRWQPFRAQRRWQPFRARRTK